jgi:hypothetical protein
MSEAKQIPLGIVKPLTRGAASAIAIALFVAVLGLTIGAFAVLGVQLLPFWSAVAPLTEPAAALEE